MNKILLALGAPLWLPLLIAFWAVVISLVVSVWAVFVSLAAGAFAGGICGSMFFYGGYWATGMAVAGAAFFCAGFAIVMFFACMAASKGALRLFRMMLFGRERA